MIRNWKWFLTLAIVLAVAGPIRAMADIVDPATSYFVPQSGPVAAPTEGPAAIANARRCPNDDGTQVLRLSSRLKITVIGTSGLPMPGIPAADICVLFNGGTPAQGFVGAGDDSIIANFQFNPLANCPDVRCVQADAPTDASGVTYITWLGHNPADPPGVSSRDPFRKWGGYAGDIPVTVLGAPLQGKLTSGSPLGSYTAHVKNVDSVGGRTTAVNQGEIVNALDIAPVSAAASSGTYKYHLDFDNNGVVNTVDLNFVMAHNHHRCDLPLSP